jgi:hypothetical protein
VNHKPQLVPVGPEPEEVEILESSTVIGSYEGGTCCHKE